MLHGTIASSVVQTESPSCQRPDDYNSLVRTPTHIDILLHRMCSGSFHVQQLTGSSAVGQAEQAIGVGVLPPLTG